MDRHPIGNGLCAPRIPKEMAALMAALQLKGATTEALLGLDDREWESLLRFCDLAHLTLMVAQVDSTGLPRWVVERLASNVADNARRFERVKATYIESSESLNRAGADYIVLKGFTQAPEYVADPTLRYQSDFDLYCPKEMIDRARMALIDIGYQPDGSQDYSRADHLPCMIRRGDWKWRGNAFDPDMPLSIELHFCLWNEDLYWFPIPEIDQFWERRITRTLAGISFPALAPVDHLAYVALHILRGLLVGDWVIHHVHELATFLHRNARNEEFWKSWSQTHSISLRALQAIAFSHARSWFCCDVHEEVREACQGLDPGIQEWLRRFIGSSLEGMFLQNKSWIWLHTALLQSPEKKRLLLKRTLVPSRVVGMGNPNVLIANRQPRRTVGLSPHARYVAYILSRIAVHARLIPTTIFQGLGLWLSQQQLKKQH